MNTLIVPMTISSNELIQFYLVQMTETAEVSLQSASRVIPMTISATETIPFSMTQSEESAEISMTSVVRIQSGSADYYQGSYHITPATTTQILYTNNKIATDNITIDPIPSNYGLITYNGSTILVS